MCLSAQSLMRWLFFTSFCGNFSGRFLPDLAKALIFEFDCFLQKIDEFQLNICAMFELLEFKQLLLTLVSVLQLRSLI